MRLTCNEMPWIGSGDSRKGGRARVVEGDFFRPTNIMVVSWVVSLGDGANIDEIFYTF